MQVQMGNHGAHSSLVDHEEPCVYTWDDNGAGLTHDLDGSAYGVAERGSGKDALIYVLTHEITRLPGHEAFVSIVRDWPNHSAEPPHWVWSDDEDLAEMLAEAYDCPVGIPDDVEATHHTDAGRPGVGPTADTAEEV